MNLNEFALSTNIRSKKKALKVLYLQNGVTKRTDRKRKAASAASGSKSNDIWHSEFGNNNTNTVTSNTTATSLEECGIIVAITEGRGEASCEVGISAMNLQHPELSLFQISDTSSYIKVLNKIHIINPVEILVPITLSTSRLVDSLKNIFPHVKIIAIDRYAFRKDAGLQFVKDVCAMAYNPVFLTLQYKYYTLTAAGALSLYLESYKRKFYAKESMKVTYNESDYNTMIDVFVADKLELVDCALGHGCDANLRKKSNLRGVLNHCITKIGARLLRSTILQPPNQLDEIVGRLDCVEELYKCPEKLLAIRDVLTKLKNFGQALSLATILKANAQYADERHLNYVLLLNSFFDEIEPMKELLSTCVARYFHDILETLNHNDFQALNICFKEIIHEDARPAFGQEARVSRVFAIKGGYSEILDFLRKKYSDRMEEMRSHVKEISGVVGYDLQLAHNQKKGYHIVMQMAPKHRQKFKKSILPPDFCQVDIMATMVTMKTIKLLTLSNLLEDTANEIINISNVYLHQLLLEVQKHISLFYIMCEQIAKLDLLQSLAHATESGHRYVRPRFDNFTEVIDGRHPLLDYLLEKEPVANNIIATPEHRLHLITGPNGSGKSIYIRQIVLLQIMAQIGCFVPATSATFKICDRILARIYFEDNIECGASAFTLEMKEIKYFFDVITDRTLIIIDELCRSTAVREGTALAMSICEQLMRTPAFIYFTTHYTYITKLQQMYPHIRCWQLETEEIHQSGRRSRLKFTHKLIPGVVTLDAYGLALAKFVWPDDVTSDCEQILAKINASSVEPSIDKRIALKINFENALIELKRIGKCTKNAAFEMWIEYKQSLEKHGLNIDFVEPKRNSSSASTDQSKLQITPNDNVAMVLTGEDFHGDIVSRELHNGTVVKKSDGSLGENHNFNRSSTTEFTETSFLLQNRRLNEPSEVICDSVIDSSVLKDDSGQKIKILQNLTLPKACAASPRNNFQFNETKIKPPKGAFLFRTFSGLASQEKQMLHDDEDHMFTPICQNKASEHTINKTSQSRHNNGEDSFDMLLQQIRNIQEQSGQTQLNPSFVKDVAQNFNPHIVKNEGNNIPMEIFEEPANERDLWFIDEQSLEERRLHHQSSPSIGADSPKNFIQHVNNNVGISNNFVPTMVMFDEQLEHRNWWFNNDHEKETSQQNPNIFDIPDDADLEFSFSEIANQSPNCDGLFDAVHFTTDNYQGIREHEENMNNNKRISMISPLPLVEDELDALTAPIVRDKAPNFENHVNNSSSSIATSRFMNNICAENTSSPVPDVQLDDIESSLMESEKTSTDKKIPMSDEMPTRLVQNILTPSTSTSETNPRTKGTTVKSLTTIYKDLDNNHMEPAHFQIQSNPNEFNPRTEVIDLCSSSDTPWRGAMPKKGQTFGDKQLNELTKRELQQSYHQKRVNVMRASNPEEIEQYCQELLNRPSVKQLQASEVVVSARRTSDGQCVFDVPRKSKRFQPPFKRHSSSTRGVPFDATMFSDKNALIFNEFMEHKSSKSSNQESVSFEEFKRNYYKDYQFN